MTLENRPEVTTQQLLENNRLWADAIRARGVFAPRPWAAGPGCHYHRPDGQCRREVAG